MVQTYDVISRASRNLCPKLCERLLENAFNSYATICVLEKATAVLAKIFGVSYSYEPLPVPQPCYQDMAALQEVAAGCMLRAGSNERWSG